MVSTADLPTYVVAWSTDEYLLPVAACLDKETAEKVAAECVEHLVEKRRRGWQEMFDDDPGAVRPFNEELERRECADTIALAPWDLPFCQVGQPSDPHVFEVLDEHLADWSDGEPY